MTICKLLASNVSTAAPAIVSAVAIAVSFFHPNVLKRFSLGTAQRTRVSTETPMARSCFTLARNRQVRRRSRTGFPRRAAISRSTSAPTGASRASSTVRGSRQKFEKWAKH
jgi:hypothetical protein